MTGRPMHRGALLAAALAAACLGPLAGSGSAATTFGDSLGVPPQIITIHPACGEPCTLATLISPERLSTFRAPVSGTIVRWRIQTIAGSDAQAIRLRVIGADAGDLFDEAPGELFSGAGSSEAVALPRGAGTFTFPTRLPVLAGDFIGLDSEGGAVAAVAVEEERIRLFKPALADFGAPATGEAQDYALLINADVVAPPSSGTVPACSRSGVLAVTVSADADPTVTASSLHVRIDGGDEATLPAAGDPGVASLALGPGRHTLEYWGEDSLGQQEPAHHSAAVLVDGSPPALAITSDQGTDRYAQGQRASVTIAASDPGDGLQGDPSAAHLPVSTAAAGHFTLARTAQDACGNSATASFAYTVSPAPRIAALRIRPAAFAAARRGAAVMRAGAGGQPRRTGAEVSYTDSQAALTTFTVQRVSEGVRRGRRCLSAATAAPGGGRCTLLVAVLRVARQDRAGRNRFRISGRAGGHRLAPGAYRLAAVAASQPAGSPVHVSFRVVGR